MPAVPGGTAIDTEYVAAPAPTEARPARLPDTAPDQGHTEKRDARAAAGRPSGDGGEMQQEILLEGLSVSPRR